MVENEKVQRALIPFFGNIHPDKAKAKAFNLVKKGGKIYLLHIVDEATTRRIRYTTGQLGEESELLDNLRETQEKIQEMAAEEFTKETKKAAAKQGISMETLYVSGDPAQEVLKAIDEYSIQLVIVEQLREKVTELFLGDELNFLKDKAPCRVIII